MGVSSRPEQPPAGVEHEDLGALGRRVGRRRHDLDPAVAVQVRGGEATDLRGLAATVRGRRPPGLALQPPASELVRRHRARVATDHDVGDAVALEIGDHRRGIDPALARPAPAQLAAVGVEHERRVERRDDLQPAVSVEVDQARGGEPARLPGVDLPHELRLLHATGATFGDARRRRPGCTRLLAGASAGAAPGTSPATRSSPSPLAMWCSDMPSLYAGLPDGCDRRIGVPVPHLRWRGVRAAPPHRPEGAASCCGPFSSSWRSSRSHCSSSARYAAGAASEPTLSHTSEA